MKHESFKKDDRSVLSEWNSGEHSIQLTSLSVLSADWSRLTEIE